MISPIVYAELTDGEINSFFKNKEYSVIKKFREYGLDSNINGEKLKLINKMVEKGDFTQAEIKTFLIKELSNGNLTNIFRYHFKPLQFEAIDSIIDRVKSLSKPAKDDIHSYKITGSLDELYISRNLGKMIDEGEAELLYSKIIKNDENLVLKLELLIAVGVICTDSKRVHSYTNIVIDYENSICYIKMKDIQKSKNNLYSAINRYRNITKILRNNFLVIQDVKVDDDTSIIYKMAKDLTDSVLSKYVDEVESHIGSDIDDFIAMIQEKMNIVCDKKDMDILNKNIVNHMSGQKLLEKYPKLTATILKQDFNVCGYIRQINFVDDSDAESKAKPKTADESVLDTSVFFDFKARLDECKTVKDLTVYWLDFIEKDDEFEKVGVSFHIRENCLNIILKKKILGEEFYNYVLQKIKQYS